MADFAEASALERADCYRRLSEDALRQARAAPDEIMRSAYEFLAEHWMKLALVTEETVTIQDGAFPEWESPSRCKAREEI
jgi:hypothetical protein